MQTEPPIAPTHGPVEANAANAEALAHVIASEAGAKGSELERLWVAHTAVNRAAAAFGGDLHRMEFPWREQSGSNPPFASSKPPSVADRLLAMAVLQSSNDPTGGATSFFAPGEQDDFVEYGRLFRAAHPEYTKAYRKAHPGVQPPVMWGPQKGTTKLLNYGRFWNYNKSLAQVRADWTRGGEVRVANVGRFEFYRKAV